MDVKSRRLQGERCLQKEPPRDGESLPRTITGPRRNKSLTTLSLLRASSQLQGHSNKLCQRTVTSCPSKPCTVPASVLSRICSPEVLQLLERPCWSSEVAIPQVR